MSATPTDQDVLRVYLSERTRSDAEGEMYSAFTLALREARRVTGRNEDDGHKIAALRQYHGSWLGAIGYLCLVDHVAQIVKPWVTIPKGKEFVNTLASLTDRTTLSETEAFAVYALRCSFAHEFALVNVAMPELTHHFLVTQGRGRVVTLPASRWNGITADRTEQNRTEVDLEALGDMVEGICRRLREMNERGELLAALRVNVGDLLGRYALGTSRTHRPS